jgi:cytochrome c oxidase assembly protein Cox11
MKTKNEFHDEAGGIAELENKQRREMRRLNRIRASFHLQILAVVFAVLGTALACVGEYKTACQFLSFGFMAESAARLIDPSKI